MGKLEKLFYFLSLLLIVSCSHKCEDMMISIGFGGDTMIGRLVNDAISKMGYKYPWGNVLALLQKNDFNIINLETTLTKSKEKVRKVFNFRSDPENVEVLKIGKIFVVNLANNHILDFSEKGLTETINMLNDNKILHVGAGENIEEASRHVIIENKGIKVGVLGYTDNEPSWLAGKNKPGTNYIDINENGLEKVRFDVSKLKNKVDIVVVSIHWGANKIVRPTKEFVDFAHSLIDSGVDIIHGHSAHIFQGIEIYKKKVIMYSTGDFVDDYARYPILRNDWSFLFNVKFSKNGPKEIELIPLLISDMQVNLAKRSEALKILGRMKTLSEEFGTDLEIRDGVGIINVE